MGLDNLRAIDVFSELCKSDLEAINDRIVWTEYPVNLSLLSHHEESTDVYFIASGQIIATTYSLSGKEIAYQNLGAGEMFGEISAIDLLNRTTNVVIIEESVIGKMSTDTFWWMVNHYPTVMKAVMLRLTSLVRFLCNRVYEYGALGVSDRIRSEILKNARHCAEGDNRVIILDMPTHEEIANRVSTHREAVTKEFSFLCREGYLEKDGKKLIIPNIQKLENLIVEIV